MRIRSGLGQTIETSHVACSNVKEEGRDLGGHPSRIAKTLGRSLAIAAVATPHGLVDQPTGHGWIAPPNGPVSVCACHRKGEARVRADWVDCVVGAGLPD